MAERSPEPAPGVEDAAGGPGIVAVAAQIPGVAQRSRVLRSPALPGENRGVGERQALAPEAAERVFGAGDRMQRGERSAGEEAGLRSAFSPTPPASTRPALARSRPRRLLSLATPRPAGERREGRRGGEADLGRGGMAKPNSLRRLWRA